MFWCHFWSEREAAFRSIYLVWHAQGNEEGWCMAKERGQMMERKKTSKSGFETKTHSRIETTTQKSENVDLKRKPTLSLNKRVGNIPKTPAW